VNWGTSLYLSEHLNKISGALSLNVFVSIKSIESKIKILVGHKEYITSAPGWRGGSIVRVVMTYI